MTTDARCGARHFGAACLGHKRRTDCLARLPASKLSESVTGYYHCFKVQPPNLAVTAGSYLFNVRHPVDRVISWYNYVSPNNCLVLGGAKKESVSPNCAAAYQLERDADSFVGQFFQACFPTVDDWALAVAAKQPSNGSLATPECVELAITSLAGQLNERHVPIAAHMTANYQHYAAKTVTAHPDKEVLVVRMEHLWDDLKALDRQLGGTGNFGAQVEGFAYTHGSERYSSTGERVLDTSVQLFCCALQNELRIYRELLHAAVNLHEHDKRETTQAAALRCGWKSWEEMDRTCAEQSASLR